MKKPETKKTGRNPPPNLPGTESWLRVIEDVHRQIPDIKAIIAAAKHSRRRGGFARTRRK